MGGAVYLLMGEPGEEEKGGGGILGVFIWRQTCALS